MAEMIKRLRYVKPSDVVPLDDGVSERHLRDRRRHRRKGVGHVVGRLHSHAHLRAARHERDGASRREHHRQVERCDATCRRWRLVARRSRFAPTDAIAPAGSVWSSVTDMSKWMRFILDSGRVGTKRLLTPATFTELVTPQIRAPMELYPALSVSRPHAFSYGLGWFVQDYQGATVWMHTGSIDGMSAIIGLLPDQRMGVYVLANTDHAELRHALMYQRLRPVLAESGARLEHRASRAVRPSAAGRARDACVGASAEPGPSLPLERYAGTYVDSAYGSFDITLAGGPPPRALPRHRPRRTRDRRRASPSAPSRSRAGEDPAVHDVRHRRPQAPSPAFAHSASRSISFANRPRVRNSSHTGI